MVGKSGNRASWGRSSTPRRSIHALCLVPHPGLLLHRSVHLNYPAGRRMYISTSPGNRLLAFLIFPAITPIPSDALSRKSTYTIQMERSERPGNSFLSEWRCTIYTAPKLLFSQLGRLHPSIHPSIHPSTDHVILSPLPLWPGSLRRAAFPYICRGQNKSLSPKKRLLMNRLCLHQGSHLSDFKSTRRRRDAICSSAAAASTARSRLICIMNLGLMFCRMSGSGFRNDEAAAAAAAAAAATAKMRWSSLRVGELPEKANSYAQLVHFIKQSAVAAATPPDAAATAAAAAAPDAAAIFQSLLLTLLLLSLLL